MATAAKAAKKKSKQKKAASSAQQQQQPAAAPTAQPAAPPELPSSPSASPASAPAAAGPPSASSSATTASSPEPPRQATAPAKPTAAAEASKALTGKARTPPAQQPPHLPQQQLQPLRNPQAALTSSSAGCDAPRMTWAQAAKAPATRLQPPRELSASPSSSSPPSPSRGGGSSRSWSAAGSPCSTTSSSLSASSSSSSSWSRRSPHQQHSAAASPWSSPAHSPPPAQSSNSPPQQQQRSPPAAAVAAAAPVAAMRRLSLGGPAAGCGSPSSCLRPGERPAPYIPATPQPQHHFPPYLPPGYEPPPTVEAASAAARQQPGQSPRPAPAAPPAAQPPQSTAAAALRNEEDSDSSPCPAGQECVVCLSEQRTHIFLPCAHFGACETWCGRLAYAAASAPLWNTCLSLTSLSRTLTFRVSILLHCQGFAAASCGRGGQPPLGEALVGCGRGVVSVPCVQGRGDEPAARVFSMKRASVLGASIGAGVLLLRLCASTRARILGDMRRGLQRPVGRRVMLLHSEVRSTLQGAQQQQKAVLDGRTHDRYNSAAAAHASQPAARWLRCRRRDVSVGDPCGRYCCFCLSACLQQRTAGMRFRVHGAWQAPRPAFRRRRIQRENLVHLVAPASWFDRHTVFFAALVPNDGRSSACAGLAVAITTFLLQSAADLRPRPAKPDRMGRLHLR